MNHLFYLATTTSPYNPKIISILALEDMQEHGWDTLTQEGESL